MSLVLAPWVNHDGGAIYSLDIHPTEDKLATSGLADVRYRFYLLHFDIR